MRINTILTIGLMSLLASATQGSQEQLATSINGARIETIKTAEQLKSTLNALNALTKQTKGDLRPAYNTFTQEVTKTETAAGWTRARSQWMASDGRAYFRDWEKSIDGIANASLRKKAQKRLDSVKASYGKVEASFQVAADKFKPLLSDLSDITKVLSTDVTAGGVKAMRSTVKSANWNHQYVSNAINSALKEMEKMQKALSAEVS